MTAVRNCHKLGDLKQYKFIFLQFWRPKVQNQFHYTKVRLSTGLCSFGGSGVNSFLCLFQLLQRTYIPQLMAPPSLSSKLINPNSTSNVTWPFLGFCSSATALLKDTWTKSRGRVEVGKEGGLAGVGWRDGEKRHTTVIK